jgi:hypothetical protein
MLIQYSYLNYGNESVHLHGQILPLARVRKHRGKYLQPALQSILTGYGTQVQRVFWRALQREPQQLSRYSD